MGSRGFRSKLFALALLAALGACRGSRERNVPAFEREIVAENRELEALFRAGDMLGVADVYADDAVLLNARGERTSGREEIDAYWSAIESPADWELEIRAVRGSTAVAYELATSRVTTRRDGALHTSVGDVLLLWRREPDGRWRITLDAFWPR